MRRRNCSFAQADDQKDATWPEYRPCRQGALFLQPSVTQIGGILAVRKVIVVANAHGGRAMQHLPYFGPGLIATMLVIAAWFAGPGASGKRPAGRYYRRG
jgi:hypothetical protein